MSAHLISGTTRLVGVMGWPVSHSLSPRMHNAAFAALGWDWTYVPLPVPPERVREAVRALPALGFAGANVTVPHKQAVIPHLDEISPTAAAIGAVNTIVVRESGALLGESTDGEGFLAHLASALAQPDPDGTLRPRDWRDSGDAFARAIVLGAGGASRAVAYALLERGARVKVVNRTLEHAYALCDDMKRALPDLPNGSLDVSAWGDLPNIAGWADLIVNCTSLGLGESDPMPWDHAVPFLPGQIVYDTVYNRSTRLLTFARSCGAVGMNGLGMLLHQGARAFELWTGQPAPIAVMRAAIEG